MSFQTTTRILAVDHETLGVLFPALLEQFGEDLPDGNQMVRTIGAHWDDVAQTRQRAASFPTTITGQPLADGRLAFRCMWQADLAAEYDKNGLLGVDELTEAELLSLTPKPEGMP